MNAIRSGAVFPYQNEDTVNYTCTHCNIGGGTRVCQKDISWLGDITCSGMTKQVKQFFLLFVFGRSDPLFKQNIVS